MKEIWKDIAGHEGLYQVSNLGRVKRVGHWKAFVDGQKHYYEERVRKISVGPFGYCSISLGSKGRECSVHRLVAETFLPRVEGKNDVNHIDGNKANNRVDNLEWVTRKENMKHCREVLGKEPGRKKRRVLCVETGLVYESLSDASRKTGANLSKISETINGNRSKTNGCNWVALS